MARDERSTPPPMLTVEGLGKWYPTPSGRRVLFEDLTFSLARGARMAVLGRNGQGKSTLIKMLGGVLAANHGQIRWAANPSWPLGFAGGFQGGLTGLDNIRFIARLYQRPIDEIVERTELFAELGKALLMPAKHYSSGMRARLAFGLSIAIDFDCYLIDEVVAVGDARFRAKCHQALFDGPPDRGFIMASHDVQFLQATCERAIIVERGRAKVFDDVATAVEIYLALAATADDPSPALLRDVA